MQPPEFISSQEDDTATPQRSQKEQRLQSKSAENKRSSSPYHVPTPPTSSRSRRSRRSTPSNRNATTPKSRLRHDNSQIQYVPVESSPVAENEINSQVLTENQKEVRDRQKAETAQMFSAIQCPISRIDGDPNVLSPRASRQADAVPLSPTIPLLMSEDDFPGSSPTPGSKDQQNRLQNMNESFSLPSTHNMSTLTTADPPSSPPEPQPARPENIKENVLLHSIERPANMPSNERVTIPHETNTKKPTSDTNTSTSLSNTINVEETRIGQSKDVEEQNGNHERSKSESYRRPTSNRKRRTRSSQARDTPTNTSNVPGKNQLPQIESDKVDIDIIPNSFSDELEQQIASQLEQDLELSMEVRTDEVEDRRSDSKTSLKTPKRKRTNADSGAGRRSKRLSPNPQASSLPEEASKIVASQPEPEAPIEEDDSNNHSANFPAQERRGRSQRAIHSSPGPRPLPTIVVPRSNQTNDSAPPSDRKSKKRRSLRLSGQTAPEAPPPEESQSRKRHKGESPKGARQTESTEDPGLMDENHSIDVTFQPIPEGESLEKQEPKAEQDQAVEEQEQKGEEDQGLPAGESQGAAGILASLRSVLGTIKNATFGRTVLREIDDVMFDIKVEAHDANRRHEESDK